MEDDTMDDQRQTPQGNVFSTPEGGPLTPPTMREHFAAPIPGYQPAASAQAATTSTPEAEVVGASASPESGSSTHVPIRIDVRGNDSGSQTGGAKPGQPDIDPEEVARDVVERLKPVLDAAEDVATKALDLSAKGLTSLVEKLEERRRHREAADATGSTDPS
jgi:hypothetical protein